MVQPWRKTAVRGYRAGPRQRKTRITLWARTRQNESRDGPRSRQQSAQQPPSGHRATHEQSAAKATRQHASFPGRRRPEARRRREPPSAGPAASPEGASDACGHATHARAPGSTLGGRHAGLRSPGRPPAPAFAPAGPYCLPPALQVKAASTPAFRVTPAEPRRAGRPTTKAAGDAPPAPGSPARHSRPPSGAATDPSESPSGRLTTPYRVSFSEEHRGVL